MYVLNINTNKYQAIVNCSQKSVPIIFALKKSYCAQVCQWYFCAPEVKLQQTTLRHSSQDFPLAICFKYYRFRCLIKTIQEH